MQQTVKKKLAKAPYAVQRVGRILAGDHQHLPPRGRAAELEGHAVLHLKRILGQVPNDFQEVVKGLQAELVLLLQRDLDRETLCLALVVDDEDEFIGLRGESGMPSDCKRQSQCGKHG